MAWAASWKSGMCPAARSRKRAKSSNSRAMMRSLAFKTLASYSFRSGVMNLSQFFKVCFRV